VPGGDVAGYRSGVDWVSGAGGRTLVAVGPTGSDVSAHRGRTWRTFDDTAYDSVVCVGGGTCWASGPDEASPPCAASTHPAVEHPVSLTR